MVMFIMLIYEIKNDFVSYHLIDIQSTFCLTNNNTCCLLFFDGIPLLLLLFIVVVIAS